jgi:transposase
VIADRGYDHDKYRREFRRRGIKAMLARRGTEHGSGLGVYRWVIERSFSWLHQFRRLRTRYERDPKCTKHSCTSAARSSAGAASPHYETSS